LTKDRFLARLVIIARNHQVKKLYTILMGNPPPQIEADSAEEAVIILREIAKSHGIYLPVPYTVSVIAEDFEGEVTV
jgi:hypothetical protein